MAQAYVAGIPTSGWARSAGPGWCRPKARQLSQAELLSRCRHDLAAFKVPRRVRFQTADALPKTCTGKIQKYRLVRDHPGPLIPARPRVAPRGSGPVPLTAIVAHAKFSLQMLGS